TAGARAANDAELAAALASLLGPHRAADLEARLSGAGLGCAQAFEGGNSAFTSADPVLLATGLTAVVPHPLFGRIRRHGPIATFSETAPRLGPSCLRGQHTVDILTELGFAPDAIDALVSAEVIFPS
ncbi:MAG TPA: hypothetical protein VGI06_03160, partial [Acidimicrobiales bacterium]